MKYFLVGALVLTTATALSQTPTQCPDYSRQLAMGIQAVYDRDTVTLQLETLKKQFDDYKKNHPDNYTPAPTPTTPSK